MNTPLALLNHLTPAQFLSEYWQKKPLLIRQAIPQFNSFLTPNELAGLACEESVQSRIVQNRKDKWSIEHGPFDEDEFASLPTGNWSLLVQSINHHLPEATALLSQFNFIPHARLDDLMVSYAPTGGSVGPHTDSYDVFLLQGSGSRRWKISEQFEPSLIEGAPLKILKHFKAEQEWILTPGDMLYLPPNVAHYGISEDNACMTYSIGFRAPKTQELVQAFLEHLQDKIQLNGLYEDADLSLQAHPAEISNAMIAKVETMLQNITWNKETVSNFLGSYLTEPKVDVIFEGQKDVTVKDFVENLSKKPLFLNVKSQMLFQENHFFINGESLIVPTLITNSLRNLADNRLLDASSLSKVEQNALAKTLYEIFIAGYVNF